MFWVSLQNAVKCPTQDIIVVVVSSFLKVFIWFQMTFKKASGLLSVSFKYIEYV